MKSDKHITDTEYFLERRGRPTRNSKKKLNILQQFQRKSPTLPKKHTQTSPFGKEPAHSSSQKYYRFILQHRHMKEFNSSVKSRQYNQEYTGMVKMSDSIQHNRSKLGRDQPKPKPKLDTTKSSQKFRSPYLNRPEKSVENSVRRSRATYGQFLTYGSLERKVIPQKLNEEEQAPVNPEDPLKKTIKRYINYIESFRKIGDDTDIDPEGNGMDRIWFYHHFLYYRFLFESQLVKFRENFKNSNNKFNLCALDAFIVSLKSDNNRREEAFNSIMHLVGGKEAHTLQISKKETSQLLKKQVQQLQAKDKQKPQHSSRIKYLNKCLLVIQLLNNQKIAQEFAPHFM